MQTILCFFIFPLCCINTLHFVLGNTNIPKSQQRSDDPYFIRPGNETDYEALLAFKSQISDDPYSVLASWNNSLHHCQWGGVFCGPRHKRVVALSLWSFNLAGTLSPFIEYGLGSKASAEGDIYSYGIVVLEMMTSKKPIDPMFCEGLNLHDFAKSSFPDRVMEIIDRTMFGDANVLRAITGADIRKIECIKSIVRVGVQCSVELPQDRMRISDAVNELKSIRQNLIGIRT